MDSMETGDATLRKLKEMGVSIDLLRAGSGMLGTGYPCGSDRCNGCGKCGEYLRGNPGKPPARLGGWQERKR